MGDYDHEPKSAASQYLRLKDRGQEITIRIASKPYREPKVWKNGVQKPLDDDKTSALNAAQWYRLMGDPEYVISEVYSWAVIDREDGKARVFSSTPGVYKSIKEYAEMDDWGDPRDYDLKITRTEEPGRGYYTVVPLPKKPDLTDLQREEVEKLDIASLEPNARALSDKQIDDIEDYLATHASDSSPKESKKDPEDQVHNPTQEELDEPINLDDIPF